MIDTQERARAFLEKRFPDCWLRACNDAWQIAQQLEYVDWTERAKVLDRYVWSQAKRRLSTDEVTAIVNRDARSLADPSSVENYATECAAIITGVLIMLKEGTRIAWPEQALCFLLSEDEAQSDAARDWIERCDGARLERYLSRLPGFAFVFLAASPSDSAASFMARDAFWAAMLGRH